jgi:protein-disulfide isomerase
MQNKIFNLVLVVILAVFLGVTLSVQQTNNPVLGRLIEQQTEILTLQRKIERQLAQGGGGSAQMPSDLSQRLTALESKIDGISKIFSNAQAAAQQRQGPPPEDVNKVYEIPVGKSYVNGKKDAPITIVEFADLQCPFCARFHPVLDQVVKEYPDKVNYIVKNFPLSFHPNAKPAAKAAMAAGEQGQYFEMLDKLLENSNALSDAKYEEIAKDLGLDVNKFKKTLKDKDAEYEQIIQDDTTLGGSVDVRGTPSFYLNGRKTNARDLQSYKAEIDKILNPGQ